jgi:hypothetical protein
MCRDALQNMRIPEIMRCDILASLFEARMTVSTHRDAWERFRLDLVGAASLTFLACSCSIVCRGPSETATFHVDQGCGTPGVRLHCEHRFTRHDLHDMLKRVRRDCCTDSDRLNSSYMVLSVQARFMGR